METSRLDRYTHPMSRAGIRAATLTAAALIFIQFLHPVLAQTGLPLPRFASLRANKVHLRTGPGIRYPVEWVYVFRGMPVEIVAEFENWRRVRDWQGSEGWVHRTMLSGNRTALVTGGLQPLRREPAAEAALIARMEERVLGQIIRCEGDWCRMEVAGKRGWISRSHIWGVYPQEKVE